MPKGVANPNNTPILCRAVGCSNKFVPRDPRCRFCCTRCRNRESSRLRFKLNPKAVNEATLKCYYKHHERNLQKGRDKYWSSIEKERIRSKIYALLNPDKSRERSKRWDKTEHGRSYNQIRAVARKVAIKDGITEQEWEDIKKEWDYKCAYCGCAPVIITPDHVIPLCSGGTHTKDNVVPACKFCNYSKGRKSLEEFLEYRGMSGNPKIV